MASGSQDFHDRRQDRENDHYRNDPVDVSLNVRDDRAERIAEQGRTENPQDAAADVESDESAIVHLRGCGNSWGKGAHDWHKPRQHNRLRAVLFVEGAGSFQMLSLEEARVRTAVERFAGLASDEISHLIPRHRTDRAEQEKPGQIEVPGCGKDARGYQQRVPRKEESHKQPRLDKDDDADQRQTTPGDEALHIRQYMERFR